MSQFLKNEEIDAAYNRLIRDAKYEIFLVTPWYQPTGRQKENIKDSLQEDVQFHLLTRPKNTENHNHQKSIEEIETFSDSLGKLTFKRRTGFFRSEEVQEDRLFLTFIPRLHAKVLVIDEGQEALVSSFNIIETSSTKNIEAGILVTNDEPFDVVDDILDFIYKLKKKFKSKGSPEDTVHVCRKCKIAIWNPNHFFLQELF